MNIINLKCTCGQCMICDTDLMCCHNRKLQSVATNTTAPIHSDPAGEEKNIKPKDLKMLKAVFGEDVLTRPIPEQMGRMYTEQEMKNFAERCVLYYTDPYNDYIKTVHDHLKEFNSKP